MARVPICFSWLGLCRFVSFWFNVEESRCCISGEAKLFSPPSQLFLLVEFFEDQVRDKSMNMKRREGNGYKKTHILSTHYCTIRM